MYKVEIHKEALKFLNSLPEELYLQAVKRLGDLGSNPYPFGAIKVKGYQGNIFRIRVGKYRALYFVSSSELTVYVIKIDKRGVAYD